MLHATEVRSISVWATGGLWPARTILLDLPVPVALDRLHGSGTPLDRLEGEGATFHQRVRDAYLALAQAEPERIRVVDATRSAQTVHRAVLEALTIGVARDSA